MLSVEMRHFEHIPRVDRPPSALCSAIPRPLPAIPGQHGEGFDEQPLPGLSSEDLDFRAVSESFALLLALHHRDLEILRLVSGHQGKTVPTVGGMILFGHDRKRHFPDAWIQAGRFAGSDKSRILDRIEIHSFPVQAVEEAIAFVQKHSWHGAAPTAGVCRPRPCARP
jgi:predicted HTH transcriptional regulator